MKRVIRPTLMGIAIAILGGTLAGAQSVGSMTVSADIVRGIIVTNTSDLQFGNFLAGAVGADATVVITPAGARTTTLVTLGAPFSVATFQVTDIDGKGNRKFSFTVVEPSITLTRVLGTETMTVNAFASNAIACPPCSKTPATINVGATLTVPGGQVPGTYVGTFNVRVDQP